MVLVCAATRSELVACRTGVRRAKVPADAFETCLTGVGPAHATEALTERLARGPQPSLVVSTGLAGALTRGVNVGSWVTATRVAEDRTEAPLDVAVVLRQGPAPARACLVISADRVLHVSDVSDRASLDETLVLAVDMESASLARVALRHGLPFMVLRLVSDTPDRPLPAFLSPFAASMARTDLRSKLTNALHGVGLSLTDPRGVARVVRDGPAWTRGLTAGWAHFGPQLVAREGQRPTSTREG